MKTALQRYQKAHLEWKTAYKDEDMLSALVERLGAREARLAKRNDRLYRNLSAKDKATVKRWLKIVETIDP